MRASLRYATAGSPAGWTLSRRALLGAGLGVAVLGRSAGATVAGPKSAAAQSPASRPASSPATNEARETAFSWDALVARAADGARAPYTEPDRELPPELAEGSYDTYRQIRFRPEHAVWAAEELPFQLQLFHRGFLFKERVEINLLNGELASPLAFHPEMFAYPPNTNAPHDGDLGFAGFRVHFPLNRPDYHDEVAVFLGASYFRAVGRGQVYGASARGLTVDTGIPDRAEEFPAFRAFWIERPGKDARMMTFYALLDGPSLTGAYRFRLRPGDATCFDVDAQLFARKDVHKLGLAPMTSMFWYGEERPRPASEFRPEVHDSDGLLIASEKSAWIWRPLSNPATPQTARFADAGRVGFGLCQRDRMFDHYQDLEAVYHRRPSIWFRPRDEWPDGSVELYTFPTDSEFTDNVVAYWAAGRPLQAGESLELSYEQSFADREPAAAAGLGCVVATRSVPTPDRGRRFIIDFAGKPLAARSAEAKLTPRIEADAGRIGHTSLQRNEATGGWRCVFDCMPDGKEAVELTASLQEGATVLTEKWSDRWQPM